ncbi:hypothetical protein PWG15_12515 [Ensifer adhaerens]|uniref:hypothetical protein n=1 Tax=Ensifer adhaerens TaxID=106592 RepID=UPI0023A959F5|nr:hypothetical protein [Ensifer adhaerens]WDZ75440.1 hypothetical protein PWG15_12515 [Ensifer adhaerens]
MKRIVELDLSEIDEKAFHHKFTADLQQWTLESVLRGVINSARDEFVRDAKAAALATGIALTEPDDTILSTYQLPDADARHAEAMVKFATEEAEREAAANRGPLTARQLRLGLVKNGFSIVQVDAALDAMPDGQEKDEAKIEWQYAGNFERDHPLLTTIAAQLGISAEQFDAMWVAALKL